MFLNDVIRCFFILRTYSYYYRVKILNLSSPRNIDKTFTPLTQSVSDLPRRICMIIIHKSFPKVDVEKKKNSKTSTHRRKDNVLETSSPTYLLIKSRLKVRKGTELEIPMEERNHVHELKPESVDLTESVTLLVSTLVFESYTNV